VGVQSNVRPFPFRRKLSSVLVLVVSASILLTIAGTQIEQHVFRRKAELLLSRIQAFDLRKTSWREARKSLEPWAAYAKAYFPCNEDRCTVRITVDEFVFHFVSSNPVFMHLDDYIRWRLRLSYANGPFVLFEAAALRLYMASGGQPATVSATLGMIDGVVSSKSFELKTLVYPRDVHSFLGGRGPDSLLAGAYTVSQINPHVSGRCERQFALHPNYIVCGPDGCEGCVAGWVNFTPDTDMVDIHRLMSFSLSCLTRILPCRTQLDIMPSAWAQYLAERPETR
jgi:hypothetical protein